MSDQARQGFLDKTEAAVRPDSGKSTNQSMGDRIKGNADSLGSSMQPDSTKSGTQKAGDSAGSLIDQAKAAAGMGNE